MQAAPCHLRAALAMAGTAADESVYVGDVVAWDVVGANRAGLRSVLTTQAAAASVAWPDDGLAEARPDYTVGRIDEVLDIVDR